MLALRAEVAGSIAVAGALSLIVAVSHERRMHRHRKPGVTYADATFRVDGGWRRTDLFDEAGLGHQRSASKFGVTGALLLVVALLAWVGLAMIGVE